MPWTHLDARLHTKKAKTPAQQLKWTKVANAVLRQSGDEGKAIRIANATMKPKKKGKR